MVFLVGYVEARRRASFPLPGSSSTSFRSTTNLFSVTNGIDESVSSVHAKMRCSNQQCEPRVRVRERADGERLSEILCSSNHLFFQPHQPARFSHFTDVVGLSPTHYQKTMTRWIIIFLVRLVGMCCCYLSVYLTSLPIWLS